MTVVTGLLIRGSRCDRAISAAEIDAIQQQPGHYSATLWDKIADWFCGTDKANALKALAETCDGSKSCKERTTAFFKLKDLAADTYKNRFHSTLDKDGITFSINDDKNSPVVTARLTPSEWQRQWDVLDGNSADEEKHAAFLALKAMAGTPYQDRFQSTLEEKGMTLSITATESGAAVVNPLTPSGWIDAWTTLQNGEKTPDERIQAFSTLQRLPGVTGKDRFDIHPTKDGIQLTITDSQNKPVFKATLPWHGLLDKNKGLAEQLQIFSTLQKLAGNAGKDRFQALPTRKGIQLTVLDNQDQAVFKKTLDSKSWTRDWDGLLNEKALASVRQQYLSRLQSRAGEAGNNMFHLEKGKKGELTINVDKQTVKLPGTLSSLRDYHARTVRDTHSTVQARLSAFSSLRDMSSHDEQVNFTSSVRAGGITLMMGQSDSSLEVEKVVVTPKDWESQWAVMMNDSALPRERILAFLQLRQLAGAVFDVRLSPDPKGNGVKFVSSSTESGVFSLANQNLKGINFHGLDLRGVSFKGSDLTKSKFDHAQLQKANFQHATLQDATFKYANLEAANMYGADLQGANLFASCLHQVDLYEANMRGADLTAADLKGAHVMDKTLAQAFLMTTPSTRISALHTTQKAR